MSAPNALSISGTAPSLEDLMEKSSRLTPMPSVVIKLLDVLRDENASFERVAKVVERDQAIAATVLKLANSPLFRGRNAIETIPNAVGRVGFNGIRDLVLAATVLRLPGNNMLLVEGIRKEMLATGTCARTIALGVAKTDPGIAFLGGLLLDVGRFLLAVAEADGYLPLCEMCEESGMDLPTAERNWLGFTHAEVGSALAKQWCFPDIIAGTIAHQHDVQRAYDELGECDAPYTAIAALSSEIAIRYIRRQPAFEVEELTEHPLAKKLNLSSIQLESLQSKFEEAFEDMNRVFHI
ncbi:MAG: HDOD domain-containing protein [Deltaproteobacteria bacterium]|nr:HDOD domain-containing protein [Deltaproteobacteria bacterium]